MPMLGDLTAYYAGRPAVYACVRALLAEPPTAASLEHARSLLRPASPQVEENAARSRLAAALERVSPSAAASGWDRLFGSEATCAELGCARVPMRSCAEAYASAGLDARGCLQDLKVLAILAERTVRAMAAGGIAHAAELRDIQARFLADGAGSCLAILARALATRGGLYGEVGEALGWMLAEDSRLLCEPGA